MNGTPEYIMYSAFGLQISSDFQLFELKQFNHEIGGSDLTIIEEDLSGLWEENVQIDPYYSIRKSFCMIRVPNVAIFKIEDGKKISYSPIGESNDDQMRLYILGTCLGVALMQRKVLPIHGSSIAIDGKAYAFVGDSGVGKSTLASAFIKRGFQILTDDVIAVTRSKDNVPFVIPSYPQQKLWQESLDLFGKESSQYKPIYDRETKFAIPVPEHFIEDPTPLAGIFVLSKTDQHEIEIVPIQKLEQFPILYNNTYRNFMVNRLGLMEWHFDFSANLVNGLDFYQVKRPNTRFTAHELVDNILSIIKKNKVVYQEGEKVI